MAIAASDFTVRKTIRLGKGYRLVIGRYTPSGTYTSGGETLTAAIANAKLGLSTIDVLNFTPLVTAAGTTYALPVYDHTAVSSDPGKIHVQSAVAAHTHSFLVKGGQAAAGTDAISIKGASPVVIGKEAATDATALGSTNGGVQNNTAVTVRTELAAGTDLSTYSCSFVAYGQKA